ncbi:MAG: CbiX/SirB N-terminal domain-containing protein [Thermaerobacter sp.]|jgi:sirohydrochlorin ferrochelatase|nr:CbiX/SirB N-terminal domain-containing protein [Thermaerobacter sp.]MDA8145660.1 CbiX/SirB N-terminal domain-containing protein [Thermaerobacter sp.]
MVPVVLLGHGSRSAQANTDLAAVARLIREHTGWPVVEPAFMELARPSLEEAVSRLAAAGARQVVVMPFFLFPGMHVRRDIPGQIQTLRERFPGLEVTFARHLGVDRRLAELAAQRIAEARRPPR